MTDQVRGTMAEDAARAARLAYPASLPKKRMAAGSLLRDTPGRILLVKPSYQPIWLLPGWCGSR